MAKQSENGIGMMTLRWYFGIINMGERVEASTQTWLFLLPHTQSSRPNTAAHFSFSPSSATRIKEKHKHNIVLDTPFS